MMTKPSQIIAPVNTTDNSGIVKSTGAFWERRLGRPVTAEEAREMIESVVGYFTLLAEWDSAEKDIISSGDSRRQHQ